MFLGVIVYNITSFLYTTIYFYFAPFSVIILVAGFQQMTQRQVSQENIFT